MLFNLQPPERSRRSMKWWKEVVGVSSNVNTTQMQAVAVCKICTMSISCNILVLSLVKVLFTDKVKPVLFSRSERSRFP